MRKRFCKKVVAFSCAFLLLATYIIPSMSITAYAADPVAVDKIDVWDFGAAQLDANIYNNKLTAAIINSWYPAGTVVDKAGPTLPTTGFNVDNGDLTLTANGKAHRIISTNTNIIRQQEKSLSSADGSTIYKGYFYSTSASTAGSAPTIYLNLNVQKDDIVTLVVASNSGNSTINFEDPSGKKTTQLYTYEKNAANGLQIGQTMTFYAGKTGIYRISSADEKLCVARIYREHTSQIPISGSMTAPAALTNYSVLLTNQKTGEVISAPVTDGSYTMNVSKKYTYDISLKDASGYIVSTEKSVSIPTDVTSVTQNIGVTAVDLKKVSGTVTGLSAADLAKVAITFVKPADKIYTPVVTMDKSTGIYTAQVESGVEYTVTAANVNDFSCGISSFSSSADSTMPIAFTEKPKYDVSLTLSGLSTALSDAAIIKFTNLNEAGYSYSFTGTSGITLRNGTYSVDATSAPGYEYVQSLTSNLVVNNSIVSKSVQFTKCSIWTWDFSSPTFTSAACTAGLYNGLALTGITVNASKYALGKTGATIKVPVPGDCKVTVYYCYTASGTIGGSLAFSTVSKATGTIESKTYNYKGAAGNVAVVYDGTDSTYVTKIVVDPTIPTVYKETLTVGATDCDYKTINGALAAVKAMDRIDSVTGQIKRVTVSIQPGNYEEMLVVDLPNVTLKNASSTPSIALTNLGVNIADQAVRITSYYGHGYYYDSMGSDCKYSDEILAVNKENGYRSFDNPGAGTTNGSYWNATVVIGGSGFEADGIIFENSYNQYISEKESKDIVVAGVGNKGIRSTKAGDTSVQNKSYVERASALAIMNDTTNVDFTNCRFVGRQDTLYGGTGVKAVYNQCNIMGGTDYIMGPMTAVFYKCNLTMNTSDDKNDVSYITAPQQASGRGYLMYKCNITSTTPGVDTASTMTSKPGYFGRPWQGITSEVVFYETTIGTTTTYLDSSTGIVSTQATPQSLINGLGWLDTLGGAAKCYEFKTIESAGVDNSALRATWSKVLATPNFTDTTPISIAAFLGTNYTSLNAAITAAEAIVSTTYTTNSFLALTTAISTAKALVQDTLNIVRQAVIDAGVISLNSKVTSLVKLDANYATLSAAISAAEGIPLTTYTTESIAELTKAIADAKALVAQKLTIDSQSVVDLEVTTLNSKTSGLVKLDANYTALNTAIASAEAILPTTYTAGSFATLTTAITTAKAVVAQKQNIDNQMVVDAAVTALNSKVSSLVKLDANYTALNSAIAAAEAIKSTTYTTGSFTALTTAIATAKAVDQKLNIDSQTIVDAALTALNSKVSGLVKLDANYVALNSALTTAEAITSTTYTTTSFTTLTSAIASAKAVVAEKLNIDSQASVDAAVISLNSAVTELVKLSADYTAITAAKTIATGLTASDYTTASYAVVTAALTVAQAVKPNLNIDSQNSINTATKSLTDAITALVRTAVKEVTIATTGAVLGKIVDTANIIPVGAKFEVVAVVSGDVFTKAEAIVKDSVKSTGIEAGKEIGQIAVFEMNLTNLSNVAITQLDGKISVSLPVPAGFDVTKTITAFRVESDGTLTKLDTKIVDGNCVFKTDHFSTYVIAQVADATVIAPETPTLTPVPETPTPTPTPEPTPKTGDTSPITMYMLIMGIAACTVTYATRKRKIKKFN